MQIAITAADTGHLFLSTLHTVDATETINRIITMFPTHQQMQARLSVAAILRGVLSQRLIPRANGRTAAMTHSLDRLGRLPLAELPAVAELIERRATQDAASDRARRIALVGLRGAGKSTLGKRLAQRLGCPFIELDRMVERDYGARIPDLIEIAGLATFRRYERACLERVVEQWGERSPAIPIDDSHAGDSV